MKEVTKQEFVDKYGDVVVRFSSYYKYVFTYSAVLDDGVAIYCDIGGTADEIYKLDVNNNELTVSVLDPDSGIVSKDGKVLHSFYDF